MRLDRMSTAWKREVLNLYEVVQGPETRPGGRCSLSENGTAWAACYELGMPRLWWESDLFARDTIGSTTCIYAKDTGAWADFLINALRMSEEEVLWFNVAVLLSCVDGG